jgi:hypothetical protein
MPYSVAKSPWLAPAKKADTRSLRVCGDRRWLIGRGGRRGPMLVNPASAALASRQEGPESPPSEGRGPERHPSSPSTCGDVFKVATIRSTM